MALKFKVDGDGKVAVSKDGTVTLLQEDNTEVVADAAPLSGLFKTLGTLREQVRTAEEKAAELDKELRKVGATDEERAEVLALSRKARALSDKDMVEAGKLEELLQTRTAALREKYEKELAELRGTLSAKDSQVYNLEVGSKFAGINNTGRPFDGAKWTPTSDMVQALFEKNFRVENGKMVAYLRLPGTNDPKDPGERVYNAQGQPADFDEALAILRDKHPNRDKWKKSIATGADANAENADSLDAAIASGVKKSTMSPADKARFIELHGVDKYVDLPN